MTDVIPKRRWITIVLGISLALNLAVVAAVAGAAWRHRGDDHRPSRAAKGGAIYMQALPREAQRAVRAQLKSIRRTPPDTAQMIAALRVEPFDPAAAVRVLEAQRDEGMARQSAASDAWLAQVTAMSAQERLAYADRLQELAQERQERREGPSGDDS
jgi:uncharacterized membrane protein